MSRSDPTQSFTRARATFYGADGRMFVIDGSNPGVGGIVSCETGKTFGGAAGSFSLTIKRIPGKQPSFLTHFDDPEDIYVHIEWLVNGRRYDGMWGLTDSMSEDTSRSEDGTRVEMIKVNGQDLGKALAKMSLFVNVFDTGKRMGARSAALPMIPVYSAVQDKLIGSPDQIVRALLTAWLGNNGVADKQWVLPPKLQPAAGGKFLYDWLDYTKISQGLRGEAFAPEMLSVEGQSRTLWDTLQEYSNPALNEMWFDLAIDPNARDANRHEKMRPALFLRERPFPTIKSSERWNALPTHHLRLQDISKRTIVSDGAERFNYWTLHAQGSNADDFAIQALIQQQSGVEVGNPGNAPIYDLDSIRKHGLRRYEQATRYVPVNFSIEAPKDGASSFDWLSVSRTWLRIIHDWYVIAPLQYTGTIVTSRVFPEIRIGSRLIEERYGEGPWEYYVEGVEHSYSYPGAGTTTLTLTRGQPVGADFLFTQYQKYAGVDVSSLSDVEVRGGEIAALYSLDALADPGFGNTADSSSIPDWNDLEARNTASREMEVAASPWDGAPSDPAATPAVATSDVTPPAAEEDAPVTAADYAGTAAPTNMPESAAPTDSGNVVTIDDPFVIQQRRRRTQARSTRRRGG